MVVDKINNIVESKKNISDKKEDSWEWRYFFMTKNLKKALQIK